VSQWPDASIRDLPDRLVGLWPEVALNPHFRYEMSPARPNDRLPTPQSLGSLGIVGKWYP
jgi:hypothetical protein